VSARCFQRGLIERVRLEATAFANNIGRLCALAPALTWVELRGVESATTAVAETELPAQIRGLDLSANRLGPPALAQLKDARWNAQLEELNVAFNELADEGTRELASVAWPKLRVLALGRNRIGPEGIRALAASALPALRSLSLALNPVGPVGAQLLARSPLLANLEELDLASARIQAEGATALARANALRALRRLNLRANQLKGPAWQDLAQARQWD
jgi:Ran GTPase-activating protein (RanGAP) involved in mRNA processing and transport